MAAEGISVNFEHVLADAVFSKNALLSIGEGTPYVALLGRVPPILPQLEHITGTAQLMDETGCEGSRNVHRLREISVSSMIAALAERRLTMINKVEIYRKTTKDRPAWVGPAEVRDAQIEHGKVAVSWQGRIIDVPLEAVRRAMIYLSFFADTSFIMFPAHQHSTLEMVKEVSAKNDR